MCIRDRSARDGAALEVDGSNARMRHFIYKLPDEAGGVQYRSAYARAEENSMSSLLPVSYTHLPLLKYRKGGWAI